jgi:hypothetical protein
MKKFIFTILSFSFLITLTVIGQNVQFTGSAKNVVRTGERFNLTYTLNAEGSNFRGPAIKDFRVLSGPHTSQNSSVQIINGKVSRSVEYTFSYVLSAGKEGIFELPPAQVNVDGKIYESNPVKIQVIKSAAQQGRQGSQGNRQGGTTSEDDFKDDVFIRAVVNKRNPMQGEQIIITYKFSLFFNLIAYCEIFVLRSWIFGLTGSLPNKSLKSISNKSLTLTLPCANSVTLGSERTITG